MALPFSEGGLSLQVQVLSPAAQAVLDGGMARIRGPANLDVSIGPGEAQDVDVPPGAYTVALEGLSAGKVVLFGEQADVVVQAGSETEVLLTLESFVPLAPVSPVSVMPGESFQLSWPAVPGAQDYLIEISDAPEGPWDEYATTTALSQLVSGAPQGVHYFRVRARNAYGSDGAPGPTTGTWVLSSIRVATSDDGSGLPFVDTVAEAVAVVPATGTVLVSDGTHEVEGAVVDRPMTIAAEAGATPVIHTQIEPTPFWVDGYGSGTVVIDGLAFDLDTPSGGSLETRSYAVRARGTYDQLIVRNVSIDVDPVARGGIYAQLSSVPGATTSVEATTINGGVYGIVAENTRVDVSDTDVLGTSQIGILYFDSDPEPASGRVEGSSVAGCGEVNCIRVGNRASVEVVSNTFPAPVLTGDEVADVNQIIQLGVEASIVISGNTFDGCGFYSCIDITAEASATVSGNVLAHVAGQPEWPFVAIIDVRLGANATIQNNTLTSCGFRCYEILDGASATIRGESVSAPAGHGTVQILATGEDEAASGPSTVTFEDNFVSGAGTELGIGLFSEASVVARRNVFSSIGNAVEIADGSTLVGSDNVFNLSGTAVSILDGSADFRFNDFKGQAADIGPPGAGDADLTCNWWNHGGGPQNVDPGAPPQMYTPWSLGPIAGTSATDC